MLCREGALDDGTMAQMRLDIEAMDREIATLQRTLAPSPSPRSPPPPYEEPSPLPHNDEPPPYEAVPQEVVLDAPPCFSVAAHREQLEKICTRCRCNIEQDWLRTQSRASFSGPVLPARTSTRTRTHGRTSPPPVPAVPPSRLLRAPYWSADCPQPRVLGLTHGMHAPLGAGKAPAL